MMPVDSGSQPLFPLFSSEQNKINDPKPETHLDWLSNASFPVEILQNVQEISPSKRERHVPHTKEKAKKKIRHKSHAAKARSLHESSGLQADLQAACKYPAAKSVSQVFLDGLNLSSEHAFRVDRKADPTIKAFSVMRPVFVARYRKLPFVFGSVTRRKKHKEKENRYYVQLPKLEKKFQTSDFGSTPTCAFIPHGPSLTSNFISLEVPSGGGNIHRTQASNFPEGNPLGIYDAVTAGYQQGKDVRVPQKTSQDVHVSWKNESERLNQAVQSNKHNIDAWLELVHYQDEGHQISAKNSVAILEKKVAILDRALKDNPSSVMLLMEKLDLCKDLWESEKLRKEWSKLLFAHPNDLTLWSKYLFFLQSHFPSFSAKHVIQETIKCLHKLVQILKGQFQSHICPANMEEGLSGYRERGVAIFQALLEFNWFTPANVAQAEKLLRFEVFWDSRLPRLGEEGSCGWPHALLNQQRSFMDSDFLASREIEDLTFRIVESDVPHYRAWVQIEQLRESNHWLPVWSGGEDEAEDSDRSVLFDDVSPFLIAFSSQRHSFQILAQFLLLLGVPLHPLTMTNLLSSSLNDVCRLTHVPPYVTCSPFVFPCPPLSPTLLQLQPLGPNCLSSSCDVRYQQFIQRVFSQACGYYEEPYRSWLYAWNVRFLCIRALLVEEPLSLQGREKVRELRREAKSLLKHECNRNNVPLYLEYAQLETVLGNQKEARKILLASLSAVEPGTADCWRITYELVLLFWQAEAVSAGADQEKDIVATVCRCVLKDLPSSSFSASPMVILKARKTFENLLVDLLGQDGGAGKDCFPEVHLSRPVPQVACVATCFACLQQLTSGYGAASRVLEGLLKQTASVSHLRELLYFAHLRMALFHQSTRGCPLGLVRDVLERALCDFPLSVALLKLLVDLESRCALSGRLRRYFGPRLKKAHPWETLWAVLGELSRHERIVRDSGDDAFPVTGHLHRVLHALKESLSGAGPQTHSVLLWRVYLFVLHRFGFRSQMSRVFYRAIQCCPWAKALYVDAATYMPELLEQIEDLMVEKELRVRLPLEELKVLMEKEDADLGEGAEREGKEEEEDRRARNEDPSEVDAGAESESGLLIEEDGEMETALPGGSPRIRRVSSSSSSSSSSPMDDDDHPPEDSSEGE